MTKKEKIIQMGINDEIIAAIDMYNLENEPYIDKWRLCYCNASVYDTPNYRVLFSYTTIVAIIDKRNGVGYDFLRYVYGYTSTSAQHIAKFFHDYGAQKTLRYYPC